MTKHPAVWRGKCCLIWHYKHEVISIYMEYFQGRFKLFLFFFYFFFEKWTHAQVMHIQFRVRCVCMMGFGDSLVFFFFFFLNINTLWFLMHNQGQANLSNMPLYPVLLDHPVSTHGCTTFVQCSKIICEKTISFTLLLKVAHTRLAVALKKKNSISQNIYIF